MQSQQIAWDLCFCFCALSFNTAAVKIAINLKTITDVIIMGSVKTYIGFWKTIYKIISVKSGKSINVM